MIPFFLFVCFSSGIFTLRFKDTNQPFAGIAFFTEVSLLEAKSQRVVLFWKNNLCVPRYPCGIPAKK